MVPNISVSTKHDSSVQSPVVQCDRLFIEAWHQNVYQQSSPCDWLTNQGRHGHQTTLTLTNMNTRWRIRMNQNKFSAEVAALTTKVIT